MMMMVTALNMDWKLPVAYFLIGDGFSSAKRAELLRTCIYHLNSTGVIVTNIVMDNCPVNYATFRRLGCHFARNYEALNSATDMKNIFGKHVFALFDPPHLSKLGKYFVLMWIFIIFSNVGSGSARICMAGRIWIRIRMGGMQIRILSTYSIVEF